MQTLARLVQPSLEAGAGFKAPAFQKRCVAQGRCLAPKSFIRAAHGGQEPRDIDVQGRVLHRAVELDPVRLNVQALAQLTADQCPE